MGMNNNNNNNSLINHLCEFLGETVTIFTTSGGASGCGFTGVLLFVNPCFCRIVTSHGTPPTNPLSESICGDRRDRGDRGNSGSRRRKHECFNTGAVCDIPIDKIASFCHNAI